MRYLAWPNDEHKNTFSERVKYFRAKCMLLLTLSLECFGTFFLQLIQTKALYKFFRTLLLRFTSSSAPSSCYIDMIALLYVHTHISSSPYTVSVANKLFLVFSCIFFYIFNWNMCKFAFGLFLSLRFGLPSFYSH